MAARRLQLALIVGALLGLALTVALIGWYGFRAVGDALIAIGWRGFAALIALHLVLMVLCGIAWRAVLPADSRLHLGTLTLCRILRDAGSEILPISPAGGSLMGVRALVLAGARGVAAVASSVVDMTTELVGQLVFTAAGVALLLYNGWAPQFAIPALIGLAIAVAIAVGFFAAQHGGMFELLEDLSGRIAHRSAWLQGERIDTLLRDTYRNRAAVAVAIAGHTLAWGGTAVGAWVALHLLGSPLSLDRVFVLESMNYALRSVVFFMPSGLGVQEGAYVVIGGLLGLGPETALALSLAKRARELAIGLPALLAWQAIEARRFRRRAAERGD